VRRSAIRLTGQSDPRPGSVPGQSCPCSGPGVVLFVSLTGWLGGPGRNLVTLLANLPADIEPVLACSAVGNLLPTARRRSRLQRHIALPKRRGRRSDPLGRLQAAAILAWWMIRHRREVLAVHANGFSELHVTAPGALIARLPLVVWFQGHEENPWDTRLGPLWGRLLRSQTLVACSEIARRRPVSSRVARSDEIAILPCPIDPEDSVATHDQRAAATIRDGRIVVGYFGGTFPHKGLYELPELARFLRDDPISWAIFCAPDANSSPSERDVFRRLEETLAGHIVQWGGVPDVRAGFAGCDVVVTLSRAESFSRTVAEAMLNAIPVVASDIEAHRALLGDNEAGLLFPVGDLRSAAEAVRRLAADSNLRRELGETGHAWAAAFAPEPIVSRFVALYRQGFASPPGNQVSCG
jgi:glycosyltransferase involved in cell wall biosynthesis